jgi:hypothetical protein
VTRDGPVSLHVGARSLGGVDDWAVRKGRTYGTILVDLERRRVLDLLPDLTATMLADRLRCRPVWSPRNMMGRAWARGPGGGAGGTAEALWSGNVLPGPPRAGREADGDAT